MIDKDPLARAEWRKSSFSGDGGKGGGNCVEVAPLPDGRIALRNSNHPGAGVLFFTPAETNAWITSCKSGDLDHLSPSTETMDRDSVRIPQPAVRS